MFANKYLESVSPRFIFDTIMGAQGFAPQLLIPDVFGFADFGRADPAAVQRTEVDRLRTERTPVDRTTVEVRKGFGPGYRAVTHVDAYDHLIYRAVVSGAACAVGRTLKEQVYATRITSKASSWGCVDLGSGARRRTTAMLSALAADPKLWLVTVDCADYFGSLSLPSLSTGLASLGAPDSSVLLAVEYVDSFHALPGNVRGLPIGPEGSSPLGTAGLVPIDNCLLSDKRCVLYSRFVDDVWMLARTEQDAIDLADRVAEAFDHLGLSENPAKRRVETGQSALDVINDPQIAYALGSNRHRSVAGSMRFVRMGIEEGNLNQLRFGLAGLRSEQSPAAVSIFAAHPELILADPRAVGSDLRSAMYGANAADREALSDYVVRRSGREHIAGRLWTAHAFGGVELSLPERSAFVDAAEGLWRKPHRPLRSHVLGATLRGQASNRFFDDAVDLAVAHDDLDLRRVAASACRRATGRRQRRASDHLRRRCPEIASLLPV